MPVSWATSSRFGVATVAVRQQPGADRVQRLGGQQRIAVLGDADRVDDHRGGQPGEQLGDGLDQFGGRQHARLDRLDADVVHHTAELGTDGFRGQLPRPLDAHGSSAPSPR